MQQPSAAGTFIVKDSPGFLLSPMGDAATVIVATDLAVALVGVGLEFDASGHQRQLLIGQVYGLRRQLLHGLLRGDGMQRFGQAFFSLMGSQVFFQRH